MKLAIGNILLISRPRFWLYLAGPFVIGYLCGTDEISAFISPSFLMCLLYFLIPANIFLYGVNDLADEDTDVHNDKKKGYELTLKNTEKRTLRVALWICVVCTFILAFATNSLTTFLILGLFLFLSFAYSQRPFRWKALPIIDSASNVLYILPGVLGFSIVTGSLPPWWVVISGGLWTAAMHLFSAIPDIKADKLANLRTTAVLLGEKKALLLTVFLWLGSAVILITYFPNWWIFPVCIYFLLPFLCIFKMMTPIDLYRYFPFINAGLGFLLFWSIFFYRM